MGRIHHVADPRMKSWTGSYTIAYTLLAVVYEPVFFFLWVACGFYDLLLSPDLRDTGGELPCCLRVRHLRPALDSKNRSTLCRNKGEVRILWKMRLTRKYPRIFIRGSLQMMSVISDRLW